MPNRRFNKQVANSRAAMMAGGRAKKKGGGNMISGTARKDEASGYYTPDMGMRGGAMMKKGGKALKKVKPSQKGLKKLPKKVRNKMGYMKKGGRVK